MEPLLHQYRLLLQEVDDWFGRCLQAAPRQIACAKGCSHCCRGLFDISFLDARLLSEGFTRLPEQERRLLRKKALERIEPIRSRWPGFVHPYILNELPDEGWMQMPEDDQTPCVLLGEDGLCLLYECRPLTCRLHGLPQPGPDGELFDPDHCTLNFPQGQIPADLPGIDFRRLFAGEAALIGQQAQQWTGAAQAQLDTFIPAALLIDFSQLET